MPVIKKKTFSENKIQIDRISPGNFIRDFLKGNLKGKKSLYKILSKNTNIWQILPPSPKSEVFPTHFI